MGKVCLVTKSASKEARERANSLIKAVHQHKKIKGYYKFYCRPIGSQTRRCIVQDINGKYDLDFQIVLTKNSKANEGNPTKIKRDFFDAFRSCCHSNEKVEDSTTVVTVRCSKNNEEFEESKEKFSFDFVIISSDELKRIRRNGDNKYTWVQLPSKNTYIYDKFNKLSIEKQRDLLENKLLPKIIIEKSKNQSDRIPSIDLFYQEVNNYKW